MESNFLPKPVPANAGRGRAIFWSILALIGMAAAIWWLTRDPAKKEQLLDDVAEVINTNLESTPFAGAGNIIKSPPPPLPTRVLNPPTEAGTLSGRTIEATVGAPVEIILEERMAASPVQSPTPQLTLSGDGVLAAPPKTEVPQFSNVPLPRVTEDSKIPPDFLLTMAQWLVNNYKPYSEGGLSVRSLNSLLGITLAQQTTGDRSSLLRYAFQPSMIEGLYQLYIDRFMENITRVAEKKGMDHKARQQMRGDLANWANRLAAGMEGVISVANLDKQLANIDNLAQNAVDINARLAASIYELEEIRNRKRGAMELQAAQLRVEGLTAQYRRAEDDYKVAQKSLVASIRKFSGRSMDDEALLFLSYWARRRMAENINAQASMQSGISIMRDLARRFAEANELDRDAPEL